MSYAELDEHPQKHSLMNTAFTLQRAENAAKEIWKARAEQEAKLNG